MKIGIIGEGAIGRYVAQHLLEKGEGPDAILVSPGRRLDGKEAGPSRVTCVSDLPGGIDLMVDCAGHAGLKAHGAAILERGIDLVTLSVGALADPDLEQALALAARNGHSHLRLASGAIGALDCLSAARVGGLTEVIYRGSKPPAGWRGSAAEEQLKLDQLNSAAIHFSGTARQAAVAYPKNANVAAAIALAGLGFDETRVELIADPAVNANIHEIEARGSFGTFTFRIEGKALPDNPRSSALAAMSAIAAIERQPAAISI